MRFCVEGCEYGFEGAVLIFQVLEIETGLDRLQFSYNFKVQVPLLLRLEAKSRSV
jgi:hypothetical protein